MALKRGLVVLLGVALQLLLVLLTYVYIAESYLVVKIIIETLALIIVLHLIRNSKSYSYILPWIIIILLFPITGAFLYLIIGYSKKSSRLLRKITKSELDNKKYLVQDKKIKEEVKDNSSIRYISDYENYPVTKNNDVSYYPLGEIGFKEMVKEMKKAKKFIFLEYFIIKPGEMWDTILDILKKKVKDGVEVRLLYDDFGCMGSFDKNYYKKLRGYGIHCIAFNRLSPIAGTIMNNRDHRKILVIDGKVAFSGGINIADEYINVNSRFGHWKDNVVKVSGDAVWNYTVMFLTMWNSFRKIDSDFNKFKYHFPKSKVGEGYVAPYGETPLDDEVTGQNIYLNMINQANEYIYICTPYLIIDTEMINALTLASKRGVDVRIVIPGIPDKKIVYLLSESYIYPLVICGVKVYKYSPGFVHAKVFVVDDKVATVGTINLDYRSLYLHFECGMYMEDVKCIKDIKEDMINTINKSHEVTKKEAKPILPIAIIQGILRLFAPLM